MIGANLSTGVRKKMTVGYCQKLPHYIIKILITVLGIRTKQQSCFAWPAGKQKHLGNPQTVLVLFFVFFFGKEFFRLSTEILQNVWDRLWKTGLEIVMVGFEAGGQKFDSYGSCLESLQSTSRNILETVLSVKTEIRNIFFILWGACED